jgi:hypothetical protein
LANFGGIVVPSPCYFILNGRWNSNDVQSGDAQVDVDVQAGVPPPIWSLFPSLNNKSHEAGRLLP